MNDVKIIPQGKRFVTIKNYCEISGLSYATVKHLIASGQLAYITTERGLQRIDMQDRNADSLELLQEITETKIMLIALCKQLNTVV